MKKMKVIVSALALAGAVILLANAKMGLAQECIGDNGIVTTHDHACNQHPDAGGGDGPIPFGLNAKVELADGEAYILVGKIVIAPKGRVSQPRAFFEVDLRQYPWLANAKRVASPGYPLEGSLSTWKKFAGQTVKLVATAHGRILDFGRGAEYVITLQGTQNPNSNAR